MGLLDELRQESDQLKTAEERERERRERLHQIYLRDINPKLAVIYQYLKEFVGHLNVICPDVSANYTLPGIGTLRDFKQGEYRIRGDNQNEIKEICVQFSCQRPEKIRFTLDNKNDVQKCEHFLLDRGIEFHCKKIKDERFDVKAAEFTLKADIPVSAVFRPDIEYSKINLDLTNFDDLGSRRITFRPDQITEALLDELGKYLMRRDNQFLKLDLSEDDRQRIRESVLAEQRRQEEELRRAEAAEAAQSEASKESSLKGLFRRERSSQ